MSNLDPVDVHGSSAAVSHYFRAVEELRLVACEIRGQQRTIAAMAAAMADDGWVSIPVFDGKGENESFADPSLQNNGFNPSTWPDAEGLVSNFSRYRKCRCAVLDAYDRMSGEERATLELPLA